MSTVAQSQRGSTPAARKAAGASLANRHREWLAGYLFILPDALGLLIFIGVPTLLSLSMGFFNVDGFGGYQFIGFDNYVRMFSDPLFINSLKVTILYIVLLVPSLYIAGLGLALLIQRSTRFNGMVRSLLFMPQTVSLVVVSLVWQVLLIDKLGIVTRFTGWLGLGGISWLGDPHFALYVVVFISVWFLAGFYMLIFLGGLQDIPREYYEAARIDGAGPIASFYRITLPLLRPTSFFVLLVATVTAVCGQQTFDLIYVMTKGGPANTTALAIFYVYQQAFQINDFGYAAAMASVLVLLMLFLTFILFALTRGGRFNYE